MGKVEEERKKAAVKAGYSNAKKKVHHVKPPSVKAKGKKR